ncbi:hypothetical protein QYE76_000825 [Lolium multiflorum]|uniref:Gnk2-homologous domain-containing protein n=1 Tax=Lolium multiflorum TaxID=4521 RepID=A0AAD8RJH6_LOLMU|nr:hypothetical protein QYE76_000825 [Lolium multiflorum]
MASCRAPLPLLAVVVLLCGAAVSQGGQVPGTYLPSCSTTGNYTEGSQFKRNLEQLLDTLSSAAASNDWFQTSTVGTGGDKVYGLIMCYADSTAAQCLDCLALAPAWITTLCQGSRNASAMHRSCLLRYSDTHFSAINTDGAFAWRFLPYATDMDTMAAARSRVMEELAKKAGDLPLRLYNYSLPYTDPLLGTDVVSGLAQCTRDLAPSKCSRPPGKVSDGNGTIAVRVDNLHGKGRCRACAGLPCGRLFAVHADFAVRALGCRARYHCRAACSLPCVRVVPCDTLCRAPACKAARQSPYRHAPGASRRQWRLAPCVHTAK